MKSEYREIAGITLTVKRSKRRKTIGLKVENGDVSVSAPYRVAHQDIEAFVSSKVAWVQKHLHRKLQQKPLKREFVQGESLPYLGSALALHYVPSAAVGFNKQGGTLELQGVLEPSSSQERESVKDLLRVWYETEADIYLCDRVAVYSHVMGLLPKGIKVRSYKSRWGSCNSRGELQFNWQIMLASSKVVDYVVIHELAHLKYFDHSPAFWAVVASVMPDYHIQRNWLRENGQQLKL